MFEAAWPQCDPRPPSIAESPVRRSRACSNGAAGSSPDMAIRLEKAGWSTADMWMRLQPGAREGADLIEVERYEPACPPLVGCPAPAFLIGFVAFPHGRDRPRGAGQPRPTL